MDGRVKRLEAAIQEYQRARKPTVFLLEDGSTFITEEDVFSYLVSHGVETPRGRIVAYPHGEGDIDSLSRSLYELIDEGISNGGFGDLLDGLESDTV
ncbi:Uncharacterised protein [uncultured Flavonifractor sp.]|uniref:hypothetical protein n=1 Tax=Muriventricola aceti TaxID=2981773 RepID=UPI00082200DB|nr:Uncharacterised protein [uncultured Flavonifractor sp.]